MRIIISPAKKMNIDTDTLEFHDLPIFLENTKEIKTWLLEQGFEKLKDLWGCNEKIAMQNYERLHNLDLEKQLTPAILSYEGIQYQYMAPAVFEEGMLSYIQKNLRILSGFYGMLKPMDGVVPYRLEMQAKAAIGGTGNLYEYWGERLYSRVKDESGIFVNLASKEYSKCIEKYKEKDDFFLTCVFAEKVKGKVVQKGTYAKMARGEMVRFMAENQVQKVEQIKEFNRLDFCFCEELSKEDEYVFLRGEKEESTI